MAVYDGVQLLDTAGPLEVFSGATHLMGHGYRVRLASVGGCDVVTQWGVRLGVDLDLARVSGFGGTLLVPGGLGFQDALRDAGLLSEVGRLAPFARRVASVCTGAFILAEAGLLDGRRATTHWGYCSDLAEAYPSVAVEPDAIFVRDSPIITSAGVTAGVDMALSLVEEDYGVAMARRLAKWLVVFMQRPGGQSQFSIWQRSRPVRNEALRHLLSDIVAAPESDFSIPAMAEQLSMSVRHFGRLFTREVGISPGQYVERVRVEAARTLLETTEEGLDTVGRRCGFRSAEIMRRAFIRQLGISPRACRERFRSTGVIGV
ncbi:DJ-1/PfpI family protein [Nonomuraea sp. B10E15]|uniref:GlxA family transcriptional regulator n=1 Tax=Nonomuraea sp. B10E15 TaxID=3153560 RepID=UPI00325E767E